MIKGYEWTVVGAGPAGIASLGMLLDSGVVPQEILWIDPEFKVGDFGTHWRYVSSNTPVESFLKFYRACESFQYGTQTEPFFIDKMDPSNNCLLQIAAQPLQWITAHFKEKVSVKYDSVKFMVKRQMGWELLLSSNEKVVSKKVILAIGAEVESLKFSSKMKEIPLSVALNSKLLEKTIDEGDTVAVFGAAQSAKSTLLNLKNKKLTRVIHFYRAEDFPERHLSNIDLSHVLSIPMKGENLLKYIPCCSKVIYATGFTRRKFVIDSLPENFSYNRETGLIAPCLYGIGIAFPEILYHEMGRPEYKVSAIWPFMKRLKKLMPYWLAQREERAQLFFESLIV